jgi:hypothetical protein
MNTSLQLACLTCSGSCTAATPGNVGIVTFSSSAAVGAMTGQGWVALGAIDVITDPTCGGVPITNAAPCVGTTTWNTPDSLCVSGSIPELPSAPGQADYTNNWGIQIGVNASQTPGVTIGKTFSTINLGLTGLPTAGLRVELHRAGDPDGTTYCHEYTGQPIKLTDFRTMCWGDITSVPLTASDVANIDRVDIQASSTVVPITVTNMCLNSITFGP